MEILEIKLFLIQNQRKAFINIFFKFNKHNNIFKIVFKYICCSVDTSLLYVFLIQLKLASTAAKHGQQQQAASQLRWRLIRTSAYAIELTRTHTKSPKRTPPPPPPCKHMFTLVLVLMLTVTTFACSLFGFDRPTPPHSTPRFLTGLTALVVCYVTVKTCQTSMSAYVCVHP